MGDRVTVAVDVPLVGDERYKNWAKVVESVDDSRASGWAFRRAIRGSWGIQDLPMGATLLVYGERGSRANPQITARVYTVNPDSTLSLEAEAGRPGPGHSGTRSSVASERIRRRPTSPSSATSCWHSSSGTGDGRWSNHGDNHRCVGRPRESGAR